MSSVCHFRSDGEPEQAPCCSDFFIIHRARPDAPLRIRLGVVQAIAWMSDVWIADWCDLHRIEREESETRLEACDKSGMIAPLDDPADALRHRPAFLRFVRQQKAMQELTLDVDPVHRVVASRP